MLHYIEHTLISVGGKRDIMHILDGFKHCHVGPLRASHIYEDSILSPSGDCHRSSGRR